jgi:hypothetical protein
MKELQMPKYQFYLTLSQMLEIYEMHRYLLKEPEEAADLTLKMYDDFYEFLEHWEDYKTLEDEDEIY